MSDADKRAAYEKRTGHKEHVCDGKHDDGGLSCMFCEGGLFLCDNCGSFEGASTTHCPGRKLTQDEIEAVYAGRLDFVDGAWAARCSPSSPAWWNSLTAEERAAAVSKTEGQP